MGGFNGPTYGASKKYTDEHGGGSGEPAAYLKSIEKDTINKIIKITDKNNVVTSFEYGDKEIPFISLKRLGAYTYEVTYDNISKYIEGNSNVFVGACTTFVRSGKTYRSFDLTYDNKATFLIKTKEFDGIAYIQGINDGNLYEKKNEIGQLPYHLADGQNRNGITVSEHILFNDQNFQGTGTKENDITKLPTVMLQNIKSMENVTANATVNNFIANMKVPTALAEKGYTLHFLITDGTTTYTLTPKDDGSGYEFIDITLIPKITNFKPIGKATVERNDVDLQERPTGIERFNLIGNNTTLKELRFTLAYETPDRLSEFIGEGGTTKDSTDEELMPYYSEAHTAYLTRTREDENLTWQSVHAVVYGANGIEELYTQENYDKNYIASGSGGGSGQITSFVLVPELPDPQTEGLRQDVFYIKNKPTKGTYPYNEKPTSGVMNYYKMGTYQGIPATITYDDTIGWYTIHISNEAYGVDLHIPIPISMMDVIYFQNTEYGSLLVDATEEDADLYSLQGEQADGNNLLLPMGYTLDQIPNYCYAKVNEEGLTLALDAQTNSFEVGHTTYNINYDFQGVWERLFGWFISTGSTRKLVEATAEDADFIFDNRKMIKKGDLEFGFEYAPYAIAVRVHIVKYDTMSILRGEGSNKYWETITGTIITGFAPNFDVEQDDNNPVSKGYVKQYDSYLNEKFNVFEYQAGTYTTEEGCIIPTILPNQLLDITSKFNTNMEVIIMDDTQYRFRIVNIIKSTDSSSFDLVGNGYTITYTGDSAGTAVEHTLHKIGAGGIKQVYVTEDPTNPEENTNYVYLKQDTPNINFVNRPNETGTYKYYANTMPDFLTFDTTNKVWKMSYSGMDFNPFPASVLNWVIVDYLANTQGIIAECSASDNPIFKIKVESTASNTKAYNVAIPLDASGNEIEVPEITYMKGTTDDVLGFDKPSNTFYHAIYTSQAAFAINETDKTAYQSYFETMFFNQNLGTFIEPCTKEQAQILFYNKKVVKDLLTPNTSFSAGYVLPNTYGLVYDTTKVLKDGILVELKDKDIYKDIEYIRKELDGKVYNTTKINNKPLTSDLTFSASDFGLANINTPTFGNYTNQALSSLLTNSRVGEKLIWSYKFKASDSPDGSADSEWLIKIVRHSASGYNLLVIAYDLTNHNRIYMNRYTGGVWGGWRAVGGA